MFMKNENIDINYLLSRRLIDLEGHEFVALTRYAFAQNDSPGCRIEGTRQAIGVNALANALSCSPSQIACMRRDGALDDAIISHIGRRIVFDIEKALIAANSWKSER